MRNKYVFVLCLLLGITILMSGFVFCLGKYDAYQLEQEGKEEETDDIVVVTSFYPMYVATSNVLRGVEGVRVENLSEPQTGCLHDFQLTPEDMKLLSTADVFVINGSGAESFLKNVRKKFPKLTVIEASSGLDDEEDVLMHAWMNPDYYRVEIVNISDGLLPLFLDQQATLLTARDRYLSKVQDLEEEVLELRSEMDGRPVILFHESYSGLVEELGLNVVSIVDLDEERQVSSGEIADVMKAISENEKCFVMAESTYGSELGNLVSTETQAKVLYLDPLTRGDYSDLNSYLTGMENNIDLIRTMLEEGN